MPYEGSWLDELAQDPYDGRLPHSSYTASPGIPRADGAGTGREPVWPSGAMEALHDRAADGLRSNSSWVTQC